MQKQGCIALVLILLSFLLTSCITNVWTGVTLIYDRHNVYKQLSDYQLAASASRALYKDQIFKADNCAIDLAVINGDILLAGSVPTEGLREEALARVKRIDGYRRVFNQIAVKEIPDSTLEDNWITTKIRSQIFADSTINPRVFKVVTVEQIVYLMGDVLPEQADRVITIARECDGVKRVVKLFKYYNLSDKPSNKNQ
jgi:osmotically-inducible protein OsmY